MARGKKTGGGSRKGTRNKHPIAFRERLRLYCDGLKVDPHTFMADMIADPACDTGLKFNAAKELAQYLEPRLKAIEHTGEMDHTLNVIEFRYGRHRKRD